MSAPKPEAPYLGCHFDVSASPLKRGGCSTVVLPTFGATAGAANAPLLLQRGFTGALDFHDWWRDAHDKPKPRGHVVTVTLLASPGGPPVARWRFSGCVPLNLHYTPLDAMSSSVLIETLALSYVSFTLASLPVGMRLGAARSA